MIDIQSYAHFLINVKTQLGFPLPNLKDVNMSTMFGESIMRTVPGMFTPMLSNN